MVTEKIDAVVEVIQEKVDKLSDELASLREELKEFSSLSEMDKKLDVLSENVEKVCDSDGFQDLGKKIDDLTTSLKGMESKKLDDIAKSVSDIDSSLKEVLDSKESTVIIKKLDDILVSQADSNALPKKLEDLQNYIAGLSTMEDKVQDLAGQFEETKEIVGIIVRQLDDIERKYNLAIDKVIEAVDMLSEFIQAQDAKSAEATKPDKKLSKEDEKEEKPKVKPPDTASLPSTIDALMDNLMSMVVPQTEATEMAESLEEVRDKLTTMIKGHTPVLFQFGKRARELKSYPPTATLNENDIASLSREIKSWKSKLKEMANSS